LESSRGVDAHNIYIQLLFETGFVGLVSYLWIFWRKLIFLLRYWAFDWRGITMVTAMVGVYLIIGYSDNLLEYVSYCWLFWFALGLTCAHLSHYRLARPAARQNIIELVARKDVHVRGT
jgi:O-antigen ligase